MVERQAGLTDPIPRAIIVMGVSGSGKSTLGTMLADALNCPFLEGDSYHGPENVAKMRAGRPLSDEDRWPWLDGLGAATMQALATHGRAVVACSALKRCYRERLLRAIAAPTVFVLLDAPREELTRRMQSRPGHYMPESLLDSQLETLEPPGQDEAVATFASRAPPEDLCRRVLAWLRERSAVEPRPA